MKSNVNKELLITMFLLNLQDNRLTFHYFGHFTPSSNGVINGTVQFLEKGWQR